MRTNKIPQYIVNAIRRRAAAAEQWRLANERICEYCNRLGLDSEFTNGSIRSVVETDPDRMIRDLEKIMERKVNV